MQAKTLTIVGMDRVGGSIGLALKASGLELVIVGHDRDRSLGRKAKELGAIDQADSNLVSAAEKADILILNTPFSDQEETIKAIGSDLREHTLVIDLSKVKGPGVNWADQFLETGHYIPAKLVIASEKLADQNRDLKHASVDLFQNSVFCIMPSATVEPKAIETTISLGNLLGAKPYFLDAYEFDSLIQGVETLPGLLAAALFHSVTESTGWRDILRFGGPAFALSTLPLDDQDLAKLALSDKEATIRWLDSFSDALYVMRRMLEEGDEQRLSLALDNMIFERERWLEERKRNDWTEQTDSPDYAVMNVGSQMLGLGPRRKD